jgi:diguanylate cyclase (GGDEF)-like protein/PAS domain S-box-containing protein
LELLHSLLKRQLKKYRVDSEVLSKQCQDFLAAVNEAYRQFDGDRAMLERSLDLSSKELLQANSEMRTVFERLINSNVDGILAFDRNGRFIVWNPALEQITGLKKSDVLGKDALEVFPLLKETREDRFIHEALNGKAGVVKDRIYHRSGREPSFLEAHYGPVLSEAGSIVGGFALIRDISERKRSEARLQQAVNYDALTGLPNRTLFLDRLVQAVARTFWRKRLVAVLLLNLNRFKLINDTLGHNVGDQLLKAVSERFVTCVRDGDTVARLGGDEFAVILEDIAVAQDVIVIIQKVLEAFKKPFLSEDRELFAAPTVGISLYPNDGEDVETLVKNADTAMSRAKELGKSYQFFSPEMNAKATKRLVLESSLRRALERQEMLLHYQPRIDLSTGQITGMEALVRWQHPDLGLVPPAEFIPLAEETEVIIPLGEWVLRTACLQSKIWKRDGFRLIPVAVNLSPRQLRHQDLVEVVERVLKETNLDPSHLELELTESVLLENIETTIGTLRQLQKMGIQIAIDDFGTGYSSLSYLKRFPINCLKIDRSFVADIPTDPDNAAIVKAIITLSHTLNLKVIAEGVETMKQLEFLRSIGCHEMQGYLFSKPVPADQATRLLAEERCL